MGHRPEVIIMYQRYNLPSRELSDPTDCKVPMPGAYALHIIIRTGRHSPHQVERAANAQNWSGLAGAPSRASQVEGNGEWMSYQVLIGLSGVICGPQ